MPKNPCHNIIPSVLWNSRQRPHFHAVTASIREGQKPASAPSPASDSTIRIMLRNSVSPSNHPHPSGRSARRQERSFAPGPSPALARRKTPHFRGPPPQKCRPAKHQGRRGPSSPASTKTSCRRVQQSCGSARRQRSCAGASPSHHLRPRSSKVEFNLAATPSHLCREESRQKCSGQQGSGPPARWRRQCQSSQICSATYVAAQNPRCQPQTAPVAPFSPALRPSPSGLRSTVPPASAS